MINGQAIGIDKPFIVITTAAVEQLDDDELRALLGHEIGHVRSGHAVYKTIMMILTRWAASLSWLPVGAIALRAIIAAMLEWWRKAELSADRAGLLAGQDPAASLRLLMKLAGGGDLSQIDTAAFLEQAAEYDGGGDLRDSIHKIGMTAWSSHPVPVARAAELRRWIDSGRVRAGSSAATTRAATTTATPRCQRGHQGGRRLVPRRRSTTRRTRWSGCCAGSATAPPTWRWAGCGASEAPGPGRPTRAGRRPPARATRARHRRPDATERHDRSGRPGLRSTVMSLS